MSTLFCAWSRMSFSLSTNEGHMIGRSLVAQSSSVKRSAVAASASSAAFRACTNGSRSEREKAAARTLARLCQYVSVCCTSNISRRTLAPKFRAIFPRQIVVLVRIPGCSSFAVFARWRRSSPFTVLSDNLGTTVRIAFTVCSLTTGAMSEKPVTW